ncbi:MAG: hypothetical protein JST86_15885 [Bacteroidetes bacterium]|nr:hypothetical protein [Bacteroidota bacterium]
MHYTITMSEFEAQKNQRAFLYTAAIVTALLLIAIFWRWQIPDPPKPIAEDLFEVNLGNLGEGFGQVQPLIKGEKAPGDEPGEAPRHAAAPPPPPPAPDNTQADENNKDEDAAEVNKTEKKTVNKPAPVTKPETTPVKNPAPVVTPAPKPQKPKIAGYDGPKNGTGNGANEDNGYRYQGNKPGGKGDAGDPNGKPDSYGNTPGGKTGGSGLRVSKGDRTIVNNYIFQGDLPRAIINALIKVAPDGRGTFIGFDKGSTSNDSRYATAIRTYLPNIKFNTADHESMVTVPFNFKVMQ